MPEACVNDPRDWGGCPRCGENDGYVNIGSSHWFVCNTHRTKWYVGSDLFSTWKQETDKDWEDNLRKLADYWEVHCVCGGTGRMTDEEMDKRIADETGPTAGQLVGWCLAAAAVLVGLYLVVLFVW